MFTYFLCGSFSRVLPHGVVAQAVANHSSGCYCVSCSFQLKCIKMSSLQSQYLTCHNKVFLTIPWRGSRGSRTGTNKYSCWGIHSGCGYAWICLLFSFLFCVCVCVCVRFPIKCSDFVDSWSILWEQNLGLGRDECSPTKILLMLGFSWSLCQQDVTSVFLWVSVSKTSPIFALNDSFHFHQFWWLWPHLSEVHLYIRTAFVTSIRSLNCSKFCFLHKLLLEWGQSLLNLFVGLFHLCDYWQNHQLLVCVCVCVCVCMCVCVCVFIGHK